MPVLPLANPRLATPATTRAWQAQLWAIHHSSGNPPAAPSVTVWQPRRPTWPPKTRSGLQPRIPIPSGNFSTTPASRVPRSDGPQEARNPTPTLASTHQPRRRRHPAAATRNSTTNTSPSWTASTPSRPCPSCPRPASTSTSTPPSPTSAASTPLTCRCSRASCFCPPRRPRPGSSSPSPRSSAAASARAIRSGSSTTC